MNGFKSGVLVFVLATGVAAQPPEPPLTDTSLTVHTLLREDVFAGYLANDLTRLARAERNATALLNQRPDQRGNILAWQGGMALYRAVRAHRARRPAEFRKLHQQARDLFAQAGQATSGNEGVPAIVGGSLTVFADRLPTEQRAAAWSLAYDSYALLWKLQEPAIIQLPLHMRGELLAGLAQTAQRTGRAEEATQHVDKMLTMLKGTPYEATAAKWKSDPASANSSSVTCKSCHEAGRLPRS